MDMDDQSYQQQQELEKSSSNRDLIPAFDESPKLWSGHHQGVFLEAVKAWLSKSISKQTRDCYERELLQFLRFVDIDINELDRLLNVRPEHIAAWRDLLEGHGNSPATIRRKLTVIKSLFSYLQLYGFTGANPAHSKFVATPPVSRDGKTPGLTPKQCRQLLDVPDAETPLGIRDRALLSVLAYSACRVGELVRLRVGDFSVSGEHRILKILGKGGKERIVALHPEAVERCQDWIQRSRINEDTDGPLFRPSLSPQKKGFDGFHRNSLTVRSIEKLMKKYVRQLGLSDDITVHSLRVTAITTARERGCDLIDLQDFAGHSDPRTTLCYIRNRNRLTKSPTYVLRY